MSGDLDDILEEIDFLHKDGRFTIALEKIEDTLETLWQDDFNPEIILKFNIKRLSILVEAKEFDSAQLLFEQLTDDIEELDLGFFHIDILLEKSLICSNLRKFEDCEVYLQQVEDALSLFKRGESESFLQRKARFSKVKGIHNFLAYNFMEAIESFEESLKVSRKLEDVYGIADSLLWTGKSLYYLGEYETAASFWDQSYEIFRDLDLKRPVADYYMYQAGAYYNQGLLSQALETVSKSLTIYEDLKDEVSLAIAYHRIGYIYRHSGNHEKALENYFRSKSIYEKKNLVHEKAKAILDIAGINQDLGEYDVALQGLHEYHKIKRDCNDIPTVGIALNNIGRLYLTLGELDEAEESFNEALELIKQHDRAESLSNIYYSLGLLSQQKGDLEGSSKYLLQSLQLREKINKVYLISHSLKHLIQVNLNLKLTKIAEGFLNKLKFLAKETENPNIARLFRLAEAIFLKDSGSERDIQKSAVLFEQLAREEAVESNVTVESLLNLTEILIWEISKTGNEVILEEINENLDKLEGIATRQNSFVLLIEVMLLKAEIALVELKVEEAQLILTEALTIAEEKKIIQLAIRISNEYDDLLEQLDMWEDFTMKLPSIAEKLELSHIEDRLKQIVGRRSVLGPEVESEIELPIMFLIQSKEGVILYSEYFDEDMGERIYDDVLISIKESSTKLIANKQVRVKTKEFTFLVNEFNGIHISYIFVGKSYNGVMKLNRFFELIKIEKELRNLIENASKNNQSLNHEERIRISKHVEDIFT